LNLWLIVEAAQTWSDARVCAAQANSDVVDAFIAQRKRPVIISTAGRSAFQVTDFAVEIAVQKFGAHRPDLPIRIEGSGGAGDLADLLTMGLEEGQEPRMWSVLRTACPASLKVGKSVVGSKEFAASYGGKVYLFSDEAGLSSFLLSPHEFLDTSSYPAALKSYFVTYAERLAAIVEADIKTFADQKKLTLIHVANEIAAAQTRDDADPATLLESSEFQLTADEKATITPEAQARAVAHALGVKSNAAMVRNNRIALAEAQAAVDKAKKTVQSPQQHQSR